MKNQQFLNVLPIRKLFSPLGPCEDDAKVVAACPVWAGHNECSENPTFMLKNCRKSCNVCRGKFFVYQ